MQDAYLRAWRFRDSLSAVPSIRPWLYRVVVNSCYSKLRREIPHRDRRAGDEPLAHVPAPGADPETRAEQGEVAETVLAALQQLPAVAARPRRPALLRRPERARHRAGHRPAPGHGEVPPARGPPPPGGRPRPVRPRRRRGRTSHRGDRPMTMLDDDRLASLLARAARGLRGPRHGPRRHPGPGRPGAAAAADGDADGDGGDGRRGRRDGRPRSLAEPRPTAACAASPARPAATACSRWPPASSSLLVLAGAVGALVRGPSQPDRSPSGLPHGPAAARRPRPTPTTTTPGVAGPAPARPAATPPRRSGPSDAAPSGSGAAPTGRPRRRPRRRCPSGAVGQSAKIEQTGSLALTVGRGDAEPDDDAADRARRRLRRLRGQLADAVGCRHGRRRPRAA